MIQEMGLKKKNLRIAIQGFGNAGSNLARMLYNDNVTIVAASDSKTGIYNKNGLNIHQVIETKTDSGSLAGIY